MNKKGASYEAELASAIVSHSQRLPEYDSGGNRFSARTQVRLKAGSSGWVEQDINTLFKTGAYIFTVPVRGKTADYRVTIEIENFLQGLNEQLQSTHFSSNTIQIVLRKALSVNKLKISCSCPDFNYRYAYAMTLSGDKSGKLETRPSIATNPTYQKGACKHILAVLSNRSWIPQIATNLHSYVINIFRTNLVLFNSVIRPALNNITDEEINNKPKPVQQAPVEKVVTENINSYYAGKTQYDDEQNLMLSISKENGADVQIFTTPENTPEQIFELSKAYEKGVSPSMLKKLANPDYSPQTISILAKANKEKGLDWSRFAEVHPTILSFVLEAKKSNHNLDIDKLDLDGKTLKAVRGLIKGEIEMNQMSIKLGRVAKEELSTELSDEAKVFLQENPHFIESIIGFEKEFPTRQEIVSFITMNTDHTSWAIEYSLENGMSGVMYMDSDLEITELSYEVVDDALVVSVQLQARGGGTVYGDEAIMPMRGTDDWYQPDDEEEIEVRGVFSSSVKITVPSITSAIEDYEISSEQWEFSEE